LRGEVQVEDFFHQLTEGRHAGLRLNVQSLFRQIDHIVLGSVSEPVYGSQDNSILFGQEADVPLAQSDSDAAIKADGIRLSFFANAAAALKDRRFEQHFETVVKVNQDRFGPAPVPRAVEHFDPKDKGINGLPEQKPSFALHVADLNCFNYNRISIYQVLTAYRPEGSMMRNSTNLPVPDAVHFGGSNAF
jgi:hypothetical protein